MIALTRAMVRQFRLMARRGISTGRPRGPAPPVRITAADNSVTLAAHLGDVVVAWTQPAPPEGGAGSLILPMSELEKFEGTGSEVVVLEAGAGQRGQARWSIGDSPCTTEFELVETSLVWPIEPEELFTLPPTFLQALHEAGRTAAREPGKYAFDGIQVRGKAGQLIATDGKQALIQGDFQFPFAEDLIVPAVPLFGAKELATEVGVNIDRIDDWLFLEIGLWHIWLRIDPDKRFPDVAGAIPRATGTHFVIHDEDAQKVLEVLPQLPKVVGDEIPVVTLDLGRSVAIRAHGGVETEIVEVPLRHSESNGPQVQVVLNRAHLGRALDLGFREFRCASPERPVVAMAGPRMYLTATLGPSLAVPPAKVTSKETTAEATKGRDSQPSCPQLDSTRYSRNTPMPVRESPNPERNGHAEANGESVGDPLLEAEALRTTLAEAQAQAGRLIAALKGFRKQHKTVTSALASLRSLRLE